MAKFIIRPEINNHNEGDYDNLHLEMHKRNIFRVIKLNDDKWYDLPTGTYRAVLAKTTEEVFELCVAALNAIGKFNTMNKRDYELYVGETTSCKCDLRLNTDKSKLPSGTK